MRRMLAAVALSFGAIGVDAQSADPRSSAAEIDGLLTAWHHAAAVADEDLYFGTLAEDAVFLGTDPGERWVKPEFQATFGKYFSGESAWVFVATERHVTVSPDGRIAWFDELLDSASYWTSRGSGVLTRGSDGRWLIRQYNLAFTIPNSLSKQVKELVEGVSSNDPTPDAAVSP